MGQSGYDIMDSDQALDVQYLFFEKYNAGKSPAQIYQWFQKENKFLFEQNAIEDATNFWLALALCQWEVKALEPYVVERVKEIVESDVEQDEWKESYPERKKILQKFLVKISKEKKTAKKPVKQKLFKAAFEKGDVITYPIYDLDTRDYTNTWGLSVCVENSQGLQDWANSLFITSGIEKSEPATMEDYENAYALAGKDGDDGIVRRSMYKGSELEPLDRIIKIGKVEVNRSFAMDTFAGYLSWVFPYSYEFEQGGEHDTSLKMSEAISIPDHPYSKWGEKLVFFQSLKYDDPRKENSLTYKETADFLIKLRKTDVKTYRNEFIDFMAEYLFKESSQVAQLFRYVVRDAGYSINALE